MRGHLRLARSSPLQVTTTSSIIASASRVHVMHLTDHATLGDCMPIARKQLHEALANLYHGAALGQVAFADHFDQVACLVDPLSRAQRLRGILLDAIEELQPPRPETFRSPETRGYRILTIAQIGNRYVFEQVTPQDGHFPLRGEMPSLPQAHVLLLAKWTNSF